MYEIKKDYRDNAALRKSFNELAGQTFGLHFEDWYQNGLWNDNYIPYSAVKDGEVIANVSVNKTDMVFDGSVRHFLQLGTVMTRETCRRQGLIREIMEAIDADYCGKADGFYLFANDSVLEFYPKFGFKKATEYQYSKKLSNTGECLFEKIPMYTAQDWGALASAMERNVFRGRLDMVNNKELILFYVTKYMQENVYYHKESDTYVIAELENGKLFLHNVFSGTLGGLDEVTALFGWHINEVMLGFVPQREENCVKKELHEEDCTFFVRGGGLRIFGEEKLRIPSLSHA
ncbi:MAG: GNAT family N-acetyltransferase [Lachnospiraceae bacterium]|nr:GNAT family N-acetyltransferase [Lachnospiraceae bacterium]